MSLLLGLLGYLYARYGLAVVVLADQGLDPLDGYGSSIAMPHVTATVADKLLPVAAVDSSRYDHVVNSYKRIIPALS